MEIHTSRLSLQLPYILTVHLSYVKDERECVCVLCKGTERAGRVGMCPGGIINKIQRKLTNEKQKQRDFQSIHLHCFLWAAAQVSEMMLEKQLKIPNGLYINPFHSGVICQSLQLRRSLHWLLPECFSLCEFLSCCQEPSRMKNKPHLPVTALH